MDKPTPKALQEATGISPAYASMILSGDRNPSRPLAIHIFRKTGWRHDLIADLTEEQMAMLEEIEPWKAAESRRMSQPGGRIALTPRHFERGA